MDEIMEMLEQEAQEPEQTEAEMTDEEIEQQIYAEEDGPGEEVNLLEDEAQEDEQEEEPEEEPAEDEVEHRARDEPDKAPSADEQFARRVREAYGGMTDEQIVEAMIEAQAQKMHEEDPEISVKAAKMILAERAKTGSAVKAEPAEDAHAQLLKEQAQEMAATKDGAALLREMLTDETVKAKINAGEWDVKQARAYYEGKRESESRAHKAPTTIKARGAMKSATKNVRNMSDAEFDAFDKKVSDAYEHGKTPVF